MQLVGFELDGQKRVWCNFAHKSVFLDDDERQRWRETVVRTMDGGKDYWQIIYDYDGGTLSSFYINGES